MLPTTIPRAEGNLRMLLHKGLVRLQRVGCSEYKVSLIATFGLTAKYP